MKFYFIIISFLFFMFSIFFISCEKEKNQINVNPVESKEQQQDTLPLKKVELVQEKDSIEIVVGTFLGNEKRNFSGDFQFDNLNEVWKVKLGSGKTIVNPRKGPSIWKGAGWTGQPLIVKENDEVYLIQGCFDHSLKKIRAKDGKTIWSYFYDDILKGTGSIFINDTAANPNNRILILQGSRLGNNKTLSSKEVWSYRAISYFTGEEVWRLNVEKTHSYSRDVDASALVVNQKAFVGLENGYFIEFNPSNIAFSENNSSFRQPIIDNKVKLYNKSDIKSHRGNLVTEASPCKIGERVFVASGSGHVFGYDINTKKIVWDFKTESDLDGTTVVTEDSCLLLAVEKQFIKGKGGILKLNPNEKEENCVVWFFPTENRNYASWKGGIVGSPAVNDRFLTSFDNQNMVAFIGIDGFLYVIDPNVLSSKKVLGPNKKNNYSTPKLLFKKKIGPSISTPVFSKGKLLVAGYRGLYLFKYLDGKFSQIDYRKGTFESTPSVNNGNAYIASRNGYMYCFGEVNNAPENHDKKEISKITPTDKKKFKPKISNEITEEYVSVVVGSFKIKKNATKLKHKLIREGYEKTIISPNSNYHRVIIRVLPQSDKYNKSIKKIRKKFPNFWIVPNKDEKQKAKNNT
ncbi:MAG: hypothetical protein CL846_00535 [Crocinitomicaceae bacterium]|nr:hypothetical protein [Crocinitomicaceae bacterium]